MLNKLFLCTIFLLTSCQDSLESKYESAVALRESKQYRESNMLLNQILNSSESPNELKIKANFLLAQTHLDLEYFLKSIEIYKDILSAPIDNIIRKKSLFMIGYIYNNNLDMYTESKKYYNIFKTDYPSDDLIPSVDYELEQIDGLIKSIKED